MQLLQLNYRNKDGLAKPTLLLLLGETEDRIIGLSSSEVTPSEAAYLRDNKNSLDGLSLEARVVWAKRELPGAYKRGYRSLLKENCQVVERIPL